MGGGRAKAQQPFVGKQTVTADQDDLLEAVHVGVLQRVVDTCTDEVDAKHPARPAIELRVGVHRRMDVGNSQPLVPDTVPAANGRDLGLSGQGRHPVGGVRWRERGCVRIPEGVRNEAAIGAHLTAAAALRQMDVAARADLLPLDREIAVHDEELERGVDAVKRVAPARAGLDEQRLGAVVRVLGHDRARHAVERLGSL